ncbi:Hypothetical protein CINCED_3A014479 [Cinara cedri]|uniref:Uncharacterized protein n=1 Tax=Cinara cedri TaxID=506608 RepID=A0A5E4NBH8_9HEMI|nr:Hypothetical protein CINCED_3A014479 [Cinara cedri]
MAISGRSTVILDARHSCFGVDLPTGVAISSVPGAMMDLPRDRALNFVIDRCPVRLIDKLSLISCPGDPTVKRGIKCFNERGFRDSLDLRTFRRGRSSVVQFSTNVPRTECTENPNGLIIYTESQGDEKKLQSFEKKILKEIYEPVYNGDLKRFERETNENLRQLFNKPSLRHFLVRKRLKWAGHVWRAKGTIIIKKVTESKIMGKYQEADLGRDRMIQ